MNGNAEALGDENDCVQRIFFHKRLSCAGVRVHPSGMWLKFDCSVGLISKGMMLNFYGMMLKLC